METQWLLAGLQRMEWGCRMHRGVGGYIMEESKPMTGFGSRMTQGRLPNVPHSLNVFSRPRLAIPASDYFGAEETFPVVCDGHSHITAARQEHGSEHS